MDYQSMFTFMLEMAGTIAFAASGAMVGAQRGMDIFGGLCSRSGDCSGRRSYQGYLSWESCRRECFRIRCIPLWQQ